MLIPYAIAVLPTFWLSSAFIIFAGAFWPILMGTIHGVVLLEERYLDNARTLGLGGFRLLTKVIFPGALPMIFSGAGMALVFSFILLTVAEMFGAKSGMGHFIQYYADFSDYPKVLAGMLFMSLVIILIMELFDLVQRRSLHWTGKR
jgi:NitT/TauT family transport system permease protein